MFRRPLLLVYLSPLEGRIGHSGSGSGATEAVSAVATDAIERSGAQDRVRIL